MKYLCLVYIDQDKLDQAPAAECLAHAAALAADGRCLAAEALRGTHTATTLRVRDGRPGVTDGPFAETREQLAGFYLLDVASLDEALEIAAGIPPAPVASIEIRPLLPGGVPGALRGR